MKLLQTVISKSFQVEYKGKEYTINYTNSDGQTLALLNRDNWEITDENWEELDIYVLNHHTKEQRKQKQKNQRLALKLIRFCIAHFDVSEIKDFRD